VVKSALEFQKHLLLAVGKVSFVDFSMISAVLAWMQIACRHWFRSIEIYLAIRWFLCAVKKLLH